ncbi:hypothetical protein PQR34_15430 [Paraburkholderia sediminicola]|uniref:hypothetical protein n=1 Tax=Paraburkholderia sediminicola TaxID=458836 RepID=UPI0038BBCCF8
MILFFHFHKAAGTTVIDAARSMGLRLPASHQNGHPLEDDGSPVVLAGKSRADVHAYFARIKSQGVQFMALEWDLPQFEYLVDIEDLKMCTVLRDPFKRAVSNFKMDSSNDWLYGRVFDFEDYFDSSVQHRSNNYYVRSICGLYGRDAEIGPKHIAYCKKFMEAMDVACCLETNDLRHEFRKVGIEIAPGQHSNRHEENPPPDHLRDVFGHNSLDMYKDSFVAQNLADYYLYHSLGFKCNEGVRRSPKST